MGIVWGGGIVQEETVQGEFDRESLTGGIVEEEISPMPFKACCDQIVLKHCVNGVKSFFFKFHADTTNSREQTVFQCSMLLFSFMKKQTCRKLTTQHDREASTCEYANICYINICFFV